MLTEKYKIPQIVTLTHKIIKFWRTSISSVVQMWCKHIKQKTQLIGIQIIAFLFRTRSGT